MEISVKFNVDKLKTTTKTVEEKDSEGTVVGKNLVTSLTFEGEIPPIIIARILNLQRQNAPMYLIVGSDQAIMDLTISKDGGKKKEQEATV